MQCHHTVAHTLSDANKPNDYYTNPFEHGEKIKIILPRALLKVTVPNNAVLP